MKSRWLINLALLLLVLGGALALYLVPEPQTDKPAGVRISQVDPGSIGHISIVFTSKAPVELEKREGYWWLVKPFVARADHAVVGQILGVLEATASEKLPADDLTRYDLHQPVLRLKLDDEELVFGTHNPLDGRQYVAYKDGVYLVDGLYSQSAATQVVAMLDKNPLGPTEEIAGFDFSRLEQWEATGLRLDRENGKWIVSVPQAKPVQDEINDWYDTFWKALQATSVEPYQPDRKAIYPSFEIKLKNGKSIHFDKLQESPELLLARPDEGLIYHFPQDMGFSLLNPPAGFRPK